MPALTPLAPPSAGSGGTMAELALFPAPSPLVPPSWWLSCWWWFGKSSSGHFRRLASHFTLPLVRSLCWITHCLFCSLLWAALYEQLACDWMILVAISFSAALVSCTVMGNVTRCVVMPRCSRGCPADRPTRQWCWVAGLRTLTIRLICNRKCCRLCSGSTC